MFKQIMAIIFVNILEFGLAFFYFWYVTGKGALWIYIVGSLVLGACNVLTLNLYASGKLDEFLKDNE